MKLSPETQALVTRIMAAASLPEAVALVPEDWDLLISGPGRKNCAETCFARLTPAGLPDDHMLVRLYDGGMAAGYGSSRHEALVEACKFILSRCAAVPPQPIPVHLAETSLSVDGGGAGADAPRGREWFVVEDSRSHSVFADKSMHKPTGYIPRDAAEKLFGRDMGGVTWFTREESEAMRAHPEWRNEHP